MIFKKYLIIAFTNSEQNMFYLANSKPINRWPRFIGLREKNWKHMAINPQQNLKDIRPQCSFRNVSK